MAPEPATSSMALLGPLPLVHLVPSVPSVPLGSSGPLQQREYGEPVQRSP
jgi:hypothetical protein